MTPPFEAHLTRDEGWWSVQVTGLPSNVIAYTQGRNLTEARDMAQDLVATVLDVPLDSVEIRLVFPDTINAMLRNVEDARTKRELSAAAEQETLRKAALELREQGLTVRDAGALLGLSGQRISQLTGKHHRAA
jgi:hypothetical protein